MPHHFHKHICKDKKFLYLNGKNVLSTKSIRNYNWFFEGKKKENYLELRNNLSHYWDIFQYVYSNVHPEIYFLSKRRGFNLKSTFHIMFKTYKDKKNIESLGKHPQNYENVHNETDVYEQKPIKIDDFNEVKEKEIKERVGKRKIKKREVAEKNKLKKKEKTKGKERNWKRTMGKVECIEQRVQRHYGTKKMLKKCQRLYIRLKC